MKEHEENARALQQDRDLIERARNTAGVCYRRREYWDLLDVVHELANRIEELIEEQP